MGGTLETEDDLKAALERLSRRDARLRRAHGEIVAAGGRVALRRVPPGFEEILRLIVYQQISLAAAGAIWRRIEENGLQSAHALLARGSEALAAAGLSRPKIRYALEIAEAVRDGAFDPRALGGADDETARGLLMALPGIGPWSADLYLLQALGRRDVFPAGDLAMRAAAARALPLEARPSAEELSEIARPWSPDRAAAARLLWAYYRLPAAATAPSARS